MDGPLAPHSATPAELAARLAAERGGDPFLVVRDAEDRQRVIALGGERLSVGRTESNDIALPWDTEVSRLHAELERIAGEWTVVDDGLSRNGTFVNGTRIAGRTRLRDGDVLRVGRTALAFVQPAAGTPEETAVAGAGVEVTPAQRAVLLALARPTKGAGVAAAASNADIASELVLSLDAVKGHLRMLFHRFGLDDVPQNQKRARLVADALRLGVISAREL